MKYIAMCTYIHKKEMNAKKQVHRTASFAVSILGNSLQEAEIVAEEILRKYYPIGKLKDIWLR